MGALADGFVAFAQPLLDQTDGSIEQLNKALVIGQLCYNLALSPEDRREAMLSELQPALRMDDEEFEAFRSSIVIPMIRRHEEMFPRIHQRVVTDPRGSRPLWPTRPRIEAPTATSPEIDRYAPCPCHSGKKYKFCCGLRRH